MVLLAAQAVVMALFLIFRPLAGLFEPIKRPAPASIRKMMPEGGLNDVSYIVLTLPTIDSVLLMAVV